MGTVAERQAERERRRREAEERKKQKQQAEQPQPDQITVIGGDPDFKLENGVFSILGIAENQALGGAQVISDQVQFGNRFMQQQVGGVVNQLIGIRPDQQNNQQNNQQAGAAVAQPGQQNNQQNNQQAGAAVAQPGQEGQQPGQEKPTAEGDESSDLSKLSAGFTEKDDIDVEVNVDAKGGKSHHRNFVNFLATDKVPDSIFGIPVVQDEAQYTEKDIEFFRRNPKAAGFYDLGDEGEENELVSGGPDPDQGDLSGGDTNYRSMSVQDKLKLADQRLEALKGTDRYDEFKQRVDAMHAKYVPQIDTLAKALAKRGYDPSDAGKATWDYSKNRLRLDRTLIADSIQKQDESVRTGAGNGLIAADVALAKGGFDFFKAESAARASEYARANAVVKSARDALAGSVKSAGRQAVTSATKAASGQLAAATRQASNATGIFAKRIVESAQGKIDALKTGINVAGHNARIAAHNAGLGELQGAYQQANNITRNATNVAVRKGAGTMAKGLLKSNAAAGFAVGGATSAVKGAMDLADTIKSTGGEGFGTAVKDTFTTKRGWKNLGLGLVGALRDVGNTMSFGLIENGDRTRDKMSDTKGGRTIRQASGGGDAEEFMKRNPSLFSHVKSFEKMEAKPYKDVGGYAIGYGAHLDKDGKSVTRDTVAVDEAMATAMLARDLLARRDRLAGTLPGWEFMPGAAKQALLDVSMGRNDILSKAESKGLHTDLAAAGEDPEKLLAAVKKHYYSYRTSRNPKDQAGLEARRVAGGKLFFGDDFSYDGKTWDPKAGFVKKGGR